MDVKVELYTSQDKTVKQISSRDILVSNSFLLTFDVTSFFRSTVESTMQSVMFEIVIHPPSSDDFFVWNTDDEGGPQLLVLSKKISEAEIVEDPLYKRMKRSLTEDSSKMNSMQDRFDEKMDSGKGIFFF